MGLPEKPILRTEQYLDAIASGDTSGMPEYPLNRTEEYLDYIAKNGGGSGGTSDYTELSNKPSINHVTLVGDKSFEDLGLDLSDYVAKSDIAFTESATAQEITNSVNNIWGD